MNQQQAALIVRMNMTDADIAVLYPAADPKWYGLIREWGVRGGELELANPSSPSVWLPTSYAAFFGAEYRLAPRTVTLSGPGGTFELPEPMRVAPKVGTAYWVIDNTCNQPEALMSWTGQEWDYRALSRGLCHATKEAAQQWADALSKVMGVQS